MYVLSRGMTDPELNIHWAMSLHRGQNANLEVPCAWISASEQKDRNYINKFCTFAAHAIGYPVRCCEVLGSGSQNNDVLKVSPGQVGAVSKWEQDMECQL